MQPSFFEIDFGEPEEEVLFARDQDGRLIRLDEPTAADYDRLLTLRIDGEPVTVPRARPATDAQGNIVLDLEGRTRPRATTIFDAAAQLLREREERYEASDAPGSPPRHPIPVLCHQDHLRPVAVCRFCVVAICKDKRDRKTGEVRPTFERKLLPACQHRVEETMNVVTLDFPEGRLGEVFPVQPLAGEARRVLASLRSAVRVLAELLLADRPPAGEGLPLEHDELHQVAGRLGVTRPRFAPPRDRPGRDDSSPVIHVDHAACILCDRCVRACDEVKQNFVIGRCGKGAATRIAFDLDDPMGASSCVRCGECMVTCPTGALTAKYHVHDRGRGVR
jgi:ferredoxin